MKLPNKLDSLYWRQSLLMEKNIHEMPNLNFSMAFFTWDLANDLHVWKKKKKKQRKTCNTYHFYRVWSKKYKICEGSHNAKVLQLA